MSLALVFVMTILATLIPYILSEYYLKVGYLKPNFSLVLSIILLSFSFYVLLPVPFVVVMAFFASILFSNLIFGVLYFLTKYDFLKGTYALINGILSGAVVFIYFLVAYSPR